MAKPIILAVDDEPQVLRAVERDLRARFVEDYRIVSAESGEEALGAVREIKKRGQVIALFVVDQRMAHMNGIQFLRAALKFFPDARKVLLTAYADTEAAIACINSIGLDHYLMKPWDPPEMNFYPVLEDLLSDWTANHDPPYEGIRVYGTLWSSQCHDVKDFLSHNQIPYKWLNIELDEEARTLIESLNPETPKLPVVILPDGDVLIQPDRRALAEKVGLQTHASHPFYDLIIIGAGPAGLGAAVYGGSEGLRTIMIEKHATGGQAGTSSRIENYLGFPKGLSGSDLARRATTQALRFGVEILTTQEAVKVRVEDPYRYVMLSDGTELSCHALIIATGVTTRRLDIPGIDRLNGAGVYYGAALAEAALYRDQPVAVVGGANSAGQGAVFLSRYASKVTLLARGTSLETGMSHYLVNQINALDNIDVRTRTEVIEVEGDNRLRAIVIRNRDTGETERLDTAALFMFIGAMPHTDLIDGVVERNQAGFILTGQDLMPDGRRPQGWKLKRDPFYLETSVPGIFAVGDVRQGAVRRVASAVGEGAIAVSLVHQYLRSV
ncbi:MAG TPA: FAD-dependent oxidoreductase [Spirillospora sp.]|nr:FAD-dependent oxidoreductase [Spirillospora sp.]